MLLRREGCNEFFKARVAAERIPPRHQFKLAIADATRNWRGNGKLFASEIVVANPGGNLREGPVYRRASDYVLFHRKKLDRTLSRRKLEANSRALARPTST
jgi:hypothetical protein